MIEAHRRLFDMDAAAQADAFIQEFLDERCLQVKHMSAEQIDDGMETYLARAAEEFLAFVSGAFMVARIGNLEDDYDR